jgi:tetratricopeptide (TPR) repeat protein
LFEVAQKKYPRMPATTPTLRDLFEACLDLMPAERRAYLSAHCADATLRARVERLLSADTDDDALFSGGAPAAAQAIGEVDTAQTLPPDSRIGSFELLEVLGEGGSSTVFRACREVEGVRQYVALKLLRRGLYSPDAQKQFRRERQALTQLRHAGIARLIEGGVTESGVAYIALELIEGKPLTEYARSRKLDLRQRMALFLQICRAVEAAHRALIVHRDLKPSNVLVTNDGQVKLLDFGIAKLLDDSDGLQTHLPAFTPAYAAPEQRTGEPITTATDVYALGIALWQTRVAREAERSAQRAATRANATRDFLIRVFRASDPRIAQDKPRGQVTARELLDLNAPKIAQQFANDPDAQIELLGVAASIYRELDDQSQYEKLHALQIGLAQRLYGELHPAIIAGLLDDADHATDRNDYGQALLLLQRADALIHRAGLDRSVTRARWFLLRSHVVSDDDAQAQAGDSALDSAAQLYADVAPHDAGYVSALTSLGYRAQRTGGGEAAEPWFRRAIAAADGNSDRDDSKLQQLTWPGLAAALESQGKFDEAEQAYARSVELARKTYGETHSTYWVPAAEFASLVHRQGERDRAHALFDELFKVIPTPWDADSYDDYAREFYATCLTAEGRPREAIPLLEASLHAYLAKPSVEYELRRVRLSLGDAYDQAGRTDEARAMLKSSLDERIAKDPPHGGTIRAARDRWGQFLLDHGDVAGAEEQFRLVIADEHEQRFATFALAHGGLARVDLQRGDTVGALRESGTAVEQFAKVTGRRDVRVGPYLWLIHAQALRRSGDVRQAHDWAQRALDASRKYDAPEAKSIRDAEAALRQTAP